MRFVATATAGTDHLDLAWLASQGLAVANAPAANAPAVADWVLAALAVDALDRGRDPAGCRVAVVGCGAVGSRVLARLVALGIRCTAIDPPLQASGVQAVAGVPLEPMAALAGADVLTLHVPLVAPPATHATAGLVDQRVLESLAPDALLVQASRGPVVAADALERGLARGLRAVLDVWPEEPRVPAALHQACLAGTAHIAGHSVDAKWQGSVLVHAALVDWLGVPRPALPEVLPPPPPALAVPGDDWRVPWCLALAGCDLRRDSADLATAVAAVAAGRSSAAGAFDGLRNAYRVRRDFAAQAVAVPAHLAGAARAMGFGLVAT